MTDFEKLVDIINDFFGCLKGENYAKNKRYHGYKTRYF